MKILSPKIMLGTVATVGLMSAAITSCSKKEPTDLEKAKIELNEAKEQYTRDSLNFVNSDSVNAQKKMAKLLDLRDMYLGINTAPLTDEQLKQTYDLLIQAGNLKSIGFEEFKYLVINYENTIKDMSRKAALINARANNDKNIGMMDSAINAAQTQIDISTGKIAQKTKEKVAKAEAMVKVEEIFEKVKNGESITAEEQAFARKNISISDDYSLNEASQTIIKLLNQTVNEFKKQDIIAEFNKVAAE